jgi:hypothetical protein
MEMIPFECYVHANAIMWRVMYRELRALMNDSHMQLNPMEINDVYEVQREPRPLPVPYVTTTQVLTLTNQGRMERRVTPAE